MMPDSATATAQIGQPADPDVVVEAVLVEEISIDGMCGVY
jgi:mycofactocin precursor